MFKNSHYDTMTLLNMSDISCLVGPSWSSGTIDVPVASLSSIILSITGGTLSSVARMVNRII